MTRTPPIEVRITAENEEFVNKMREIIQALRNTRSDADGAGGALSGFGAKLAQLGMIATGVQAAFQMLSSAIREVSEVTIDFSAKMETAEVSFQTMLHDAQLGTKFLQDLKKIAADTPFTLPGVTSAGKKLLAFGFGAENALHMLRTIGDASAALGLGTEGIDRITIALGQMKAKGRAMGQEMLQLNEAGINAQEILAKKLGLTSDQLDQMGRAGIDADVAIKALLEGMDEQYSGMAAKLSDTFEGMKNAIKDNLSNVASFAAQPIFKAIEDAMMRVRDASVGFVNIINGIADIDPSDGLVQFVAALRVGMEGIVDLAKEFIEDFGSFNDDGSFTFSQESLAAFDEARTLCVDIYELAKHIGEAFVGCVPYIGDIVQGLGYWLDIVVETADVLLRIAGVILGWIANQLEYVLNVLGGILGINLGIHRVVVLITEALAGFYVIRTIIGLVQALYKAFLATRLAIMAVIAAIKSATIAQMAWNAAQAIGQMVKSPVGLAALGIGAVGVGVGLATGKLQEGAHAVSGWLGQKMKDNLGFNLADLTDPGGDILSAGRNDFNSKLEAEINNLVKGNQQAKENRAKPYAPQRPSAIKRVDKNADKEAKARERADKKAEAARRKAEAEARKARQEQLRINREALQEQTRIIRDAQEKQIEILKNAMEAIEVAYKQNRIGWAEYAQEKIENEIEQKRAEIASLQAQIKATKESDSFEHEYERQRELSRLSSALEKTERELGRLTDTQRDVANVIEAYTNKNIVGTQNNQNQTQAQVQGTPQGVTDKEKFAHGIMVDVQKALESWGTQNGISGEAVDTVLNAANSYGVDPRLVLSVLKQESQGNPNVVSPAGAIGYMQLMPATAKGLGVDPWNPTENIYGGVKYLAQLLREFNGDFTKALAAYNAGPWAVQKYGGVPPYPETQEYVRIIKGHLDSMHDITDVRPYMEANASYNKKAWATQQAGQVAGQSIVASAAQGIQAGLDAGFKAWNGVTMPNGRNGCVEAVVRIGSWFNDFLTKEVKNNVNNVDVLRDDAKGYGVPEIPFDENKLKTGDTIVYYNGQPNGHVLLYKGDGRTVGNSSNANGGIGGVKEQGVYIKGLTPTSILQTGTYGVAKNLLQPQPAPKPQLAQPTDNSPTNKHVAKTKEGFEAEKEAVSATNKANEQLKEAENIKGQENGTYAKKVRRDKAEEEKREFKANGREDAAKAVDLKLEDDDAQATFKDFQSTMQKTVKDFEGTMHNYKLHASLGEVPPTQGVAYAATQLSPVLAPNSSLNKLRKTLEEQLQRAKNIPDPRLANDIAERIRSLDEAFETQVKDFTQAAEDYTSWKKNMVDADFHLSKGQKDHDKEMADRENYAEKANIARTQFGTYWNAAQDAQDPRQRDNYLSLAKQAEMAAQLNDELARIPTLLEETRATAKDSLEDGLLTFLTDGINEANSLGEAFRNLVTSILKDLQKLFAKKIVGNLMNQWFPQMGIGATLAGDSPVPMAAGSSDSRGFTKYRAAGGLITGEGTETSDSIPAMLSNGEFVMRAKAVKKYGLAMLERINNGSFGKIRVNMPHYSGGGLVGDAGATVAEKFGFDNLAPTVMNQMTVKNYVDGKRVFDSYGKEFVRSEISRATVRDAKRNVLMGRRVR